MKEEFKPAIRVPHILLLTLLISSILFTKYQIDEAKRIADRKQNENLFLIKNDHLFEIRRLVGEEKESNKVCKKADKDLQDYYGGDDSKISLDKKDDDSEKRPAYIQALIDLIEHFADKIFGGSEEGGENGAGDGGSGDPGSRRRISEDGKGEGKSEVDKEVTENALKYGMHLLPILGFIVIAILSIPGWIICCGCCFCNCCCCCCCKKPCCRFPFFIIVMAFDLIVVICCLYGLIQSNKVFVGIANFECATLKFVDEVTDGQTNGKWNGIDKNYEFLTNISKTVENFNPSDNLQTKLDNTNTALTGLDNQISDSGVKEEESLFKTIQRWDKNENVEIMLLPVKSFGSGQETSGKTICGELKSYYSEIATKTQEQAQSAKKNLGTVDTKKEDIQKYMEKANKALEDINGPVNDVKNMISSFINPAIADTIDGTGKTVFKAIFSVLTVFDVAIAALVIIYFLFGTTLCLKRRCCRCLNKCFIHCLWNILALLMIFTFLIGSIFTVIGMVGKDLVSVISYIIGPENIARGENALLIGRFANYIDRCLYGDGNLAAELNLTMGDGVGSFEELNDASKQLDEMNKEFEKIENINTFSVYENMLTEYKEYNGVIFCEKSKTLEECMNGESTYSLDLLMETFNQGQGHYTIVKDSSLCTDISNCIFIKNDASASAGTNIDDITPDSDSNLNEPTKKQLKIIKKMKECIPSHLDTMNTKISGVKTAYTNLMTEEKTMIPFMQEQVGNITILFNDFVGKDADIWSFINCKFIGNNIDLILKYLKEALGKYVYSVGIMLLLSGCSIGVSICFTIFEVILINKAVDEKLEENKAEEEVAENSEEGRVVQYKMA